MKEIEKTLFEGIRFTRNGQSFKRVIYGTMLEFSIETGRGWTIRNLGPVLQTFSLSIVRTEEKITAFPKTYVHEEMMVNKGQHFIAPLQTFSGYPFSLQLVATRYWDEMAPSEMEGTETNVVQILQQMSSAYGKILNALESVKFPEIVSKEKIETYKEECEGMKMKWCPALFLLGEANEMKELVESHDLCMNKLDQLLPWAELHDLVHGDAEKLKALIREVVNKNMVAVRHVEMEEVD
jgi:hypothetical protein